MSNCRIGRSCNRCNNLVKVESITANATCVIITIPFNVYCNGRQLCILLNKSIPSTSNPLPVFFKFDNDETLYSFMTKCGNHIYSDQIVSRRIYPINIATDSNIFMFKYSGRFLPKTSKVFPPTMPSTVIKGKKHAEE